MQNWGLMAALINLIYLLNADVSRRYFTWLFFNDKGLRLVCSIITDILNSRSAVINVFLSERFLKTQLHMS